MKRQTRVPMSARAPVEAVGWRETLPIKLAIGLQCLAWSFQLPYVPLFFQEQLHASKVVIAAVMAMQVGIQVVVAPTALGTLPQVLQ